MHIFIGVPTHSGTVQIECLASIFSLQRHLKLNHPSIDLSLSWVTGTPIDIARNILAHRFLGTAGATHLLYLDDDMGFEPSLVDRLVREDRPLVSTFCPNRHLDVSALARLASDKPSKEALMSIAADYVATGHIIHSDGKFEPSKTGFVQVSSIGTGIMLIRRDVFEIIGQDKELWRPPNDRRYARLGITDAVLQAFAPMLDEDGLWLSEDLSFCRRWTAGGGEIWACVDELVTHVGRIVITGRLRDKLDHYGGL